MDGERERQLSRWDPWEEREDRKVAKGVRGEEGERRVGKGNYRVT